MCILRRTSTHLRVCTRWNQRELVLALRTANDIGAPIGALFHSHPTGAAYPLATDVVTDVDRDWVHLIVGLAGKVPVLRAFRVGTGGVRPVGVVNSSVEQR